VEGQAFLTTIAGLSLSLAGFASLIAWLRESGATWDPVNLWRVKTIVRDALTLAILSLSLVPYYTLTESMTSTIRFGSGALAVLAVADLLRTRHRDPVVWTPAFTWVVFHVTNTLYLALHVVNLFVVELGLLQVGLLLLLASPAGIFSNFVRELGRAPATAEAD
jgi:hypothetical protein